MKPLVVAITGASGAIYAQRLLRVLAAEEQKVHLTISPAGAAVLAQELDIDVDLDRFDDEAIHKLGISNPSHLVYHHHRDLMASMASGSFLTRGMVICPCSGGTLSAIAQGTSGNLIHRAADVHLKEGRKLILVPRETPLSLVQIENLKQACLAGAVILPAMPGWYHGVRELQDIVDFVVARILDQLGIAHDLMRRWGTQPTDETQPI